MEGALPAATAFRHFVLPLVPQKTLTVVPLTRHTAAPWWHRLDVAPADLPQPAWRDVFLEAYGMALDGVSDRRAVRMLVQQAGCDRLSVETARDHFVGLLAEDREPTVERALHYLQGALSYGDGHHVWDRGGARRFSVWPLGTS